MVYVTKIGSSPLLPTMALGFTTPQVGGGASLKPKRIGGIKQPCNEKKCDRQAGLGEIAPCRASSTSDEATTEYPGIVDTPRPQKIDWKDVILVQAFGWESSKQGGTWYESVKEKIPLLEEMKVSHVWLPPPSKSVSLEGYLPNQYYDLDSAYGNFESLTSLNKSLLEAGLRPVADIVINHRCADAQDENGIWNHFRDDVPHPGAKIDWGPWAITCNDPDFNGSGSQDSGSDYGPSPDLDLSNPKVQEGILDWLLWMEKYVGFQGWRLDFAKGYSPDIANFFISETLDPKDFAVAEYWADAKWNGSTLEYNQDQMRQDLCDWIDQAKVSAAFDFPTKALLQEAVRNCEYDRMRDADGKPPGLLGWWPSHAVSFIDNHDTGSSARHWPFPDDGILQGYAYILTHPGVPCLFWEHIIDPALSKSISDLSNLRRRSGIHSQSKVSILAAEKDMYVALVGDSVLCKLGPRFDMGHLAPSDEWVLSCSGTDWAVWEKASS